jgi:oxygen-independent coproporphyrinogen-3 oxidase
MPHSPAAPPAPRARAADDRDGPPPPAHPPPRSAYIHLPFCKKKCLYCDFPVIAVGSRPGDEQVQDSMAAYVDALCREIAATRRLNPPDAPLRTLFFGGGTPSLLPPAQLERLVTAVERAYGLAPDAEVSIEADPGTFGAAALRTYRSLGVTRVSVGVQAFDDALLSACGRAHDLADVYKAIEAVYAAGVPSWSLDLMSGLPGLTPEGWRAGLEAALDAAPPHLSVYDLQVEEGTPFAKLYRPGAAPLPSDGAAAGMYCEASQVLRGAGYEHYEVSNYALEGHRCAHNMAYWEGRSYYAFGMGAASHLEGRRFSRPRRLAAYQRWLTGVEEAVGAPDNRGQPVVPGAELPPEPASEVLLDTVMLRLRLGAGLDLRAVAADFADGRDAADLIVGALHEHVQRGHVVLERDEGGSGEVVRVRLTDPAGFVVSNDVISDVFLALEELQRG